uniref:ABC transporter transmembrane domain-containing protein n=1 Tax=Shimia gijangensis TaxID=1470563 RepID=UPI001FE511DD
MLALTTCLFPLLFLTLELPKRIINDAISADQPYVYIDWLDIELDQVTFLMVLCGAFLLSVLVHGLTKMRINTMKGILSERMLRRFRYQLISRIMRFPQPYLRRTSQGEMVSMITSEAEPMGGMMGDAISLPVLQAGQMATILVFLFAQSVWFGLAAVALIPLQAWVIPKLQRQINLHNKDRIQEVRKLSAEIGETATGAATLRVNAGWRFRLAEITRRLGTLFDIRLTIYKKKFFMKFLNNFITQLTPFFFYMIGGLLVIRGQVSLGALVAALAAYKDLSSPWKELLNYYNRVQDMGLRWHLISERFDPIGMVDEELFDGTPEEIGHLDGDIELKRVTVTDHSGDAILEDISLTIPNNALVAISATDQEERHAIAELLTREVLPAAGKVLMGGRDLNELHQMVIAARIGYAEVSPYVFQGTFGGNLMMPLRHQPLDAVILPDDLRVGEEARDSESMRSGNSTDNFNANWVDPTIAGVGDVDGLRDWWVHLVEAMGTGSAMFRRGLEQTFDAASHPELARRIIELRPRIRAELEREGLDQAYYRFDPEAYNPALPLSANLFFATARQSVGNYTHSTANDFLELLNELELSDGMLRLSVEVIEMLHQTFGVDGTEHPLFRRLGLNPDLFEDKVALARKVREHSLEVLERDEKVQLLHLPFEVSAEQIGPAFTDELKQLILDLRHKQRAKIENWVADYFVPLSEDSFAPGLSLLENSIYGTLPSSGGRGEAIHEVVERVLSEEHLKHHVAELLFEMPTGLAGAGMPSAFVEPLSISRAALKRPDVLILDGCIATDDPEECRRAIRSLRKLFPEAVLIFLEDTHKNPEEFDMLIEIEHGRIKDSAQQSEAIQDNAASADLRQKMRALVSTDLFSGLDRKQLRVLAFGAQWFEAPADTFVFRQGDDASDGAYLILEGEAEMYLVDPDGTRNLVTVAGPGTLVGELALIKGGQRALDMYVPTEFKALRLGEEEFLAVVGNDGGTAFKIMQVLATYVGASSSQIESEAVEDVAQADLLDSDDSGV